MQPCRWSPPALLLEAELAASSLTPPEITAALNEDNHFTVSLALCLDISVLLHRGEFPSTTQELGGER